MGILQNFRRFIWLLLSIAMLTGQAHAQPEPGNPLHQ
jgi:hypothetical protein